MEITLQGGSAGSLDRWALLQLSKPLRQQRDLRKVDIQEQLSQLLFGVDLSPGELQLYRARLLDAISRVDQLEHSGLLSVSPKLAIPRSNLMMQVGTIGWLPSTQISKTVEATPAHEIHSRNLAKALGTALALNPKSAHQSFHSVGIVVAQGSEGVRWGEDKVELTQWSLKIMNAKDFPQVARLRLPPRFPTQAEMVQFRAS